MQWGRCSGDGAQLRSWDFSCANVIQKHNQRKSHILQTICVFEPKCNKNSYYNCLPNNSNIFITSEFVVMIAFSLQIMWTFPFDMLSVIFC